MVDARREAWITGVGIVSCLGEGPDAHWQALMQGSPTADTTTFAPFVVHPIKPIDFDKQIPKKGDQRQMEPWQRIGTYAAGLALESANVKGKPEILSRMDMVVCAAGGERDLTADSGILAGISGAQDPAAFLNERLMNDLRPTLFLAQLSNLLAGNISIVHGVTGSSRSFLGEEVAGVNAVRDGFARISAGQSDLVLVGGAYNGERKDLFLLFEFGDFNLKDQFLPVWQRAPRGGLALGSMGAFLVIEAADHARGRGAAPIARMSAMMSDLTTSKPGAVTAALRRMWESIQPRLQPDQLAIISGASGAEPVTGEERAFLNEHPAVPVRAAGSYIGHGMDAQFPASLALAALAVSRGSLFAPAEQEEDAMTGHLGQVVVTSVGHWRGAGMALVESA